MKSMAYRNVKKQKQLLLMMGVVAGAVLLSIGLGAVVFLSGQKQDLRQQASGSDYVGCAGGTVKDGEHTCRGTTTNDCMRCVAGSLVLADPRKCIGKPCGFKITPTAAPTRVPGAGKDCSGFAKPDQPYCGSTAAGTCLKCVNGRGVPNPGGCNDVKFPCRNR